VEARGAPLTRIRIDCKGKGPRLTSHTKDTGAEATGPPTGTEHSTATRRRVEERHVAVDLHTYTPQTPHPEQQQQQQQQQHTIHG
jgi:hypothetical protein